MLRLLISLCVFLLFKDATSQMPGFVSLDCGGADNFTDDIGLQWTPDSHMITGRTASISVSNETRQQYKTLRYFAVDNTKYCYTLDVNARTRYLIRATFLYGNFDNNNVFPKFDISFGPMHWTTIVISDTDTVEVEELIFLATGPTISVCLYRATTGQPFISTLELRQFNGSAYFNQFENDFYLRVSARINFGAESDAPVRYPDDPFDRIWESDSIKKANYLVDIAPGTEKISTKSPIDVGSGEMPPQKVMQTAVVGTNGSLTYRMDLDGFPGFGWAFTYLAEIEELNTSDSRKFKLVLPENPDISKLILNIQENAQGPNRLYEPGSYNISLPFVLPFRFEKTNDSNMGPLLNAVEINKYLEKIQGSADGAILGDVIARYSSSPWALEGGDPCLPVPWSWVQCSSDLQPRITAIKLSGKSLRGNIPIELTELSGLVELWLDNNSLSGTIPDFSGCPNLKIIHLEDNQLTGRLSSSLAKLSNLRELYVQNNMLSGKVPSDLLKKKNLVLNYTGNTGFHKGGRDKKIIIISTVVPALLLVSAAITSSCILRRRKSHPKQEKLEHSATESASYFTLSEIKSATKNFKKQVGSGGFGVVYYGRLKNGKEIAVKVLSNDSKQGKQEFANEVSLLSRINHRNLVQFLGYCREGGAGILVYEFMHKGTLKDHIYGHSKHRKSISWIERLQIAEDAAKGVEYLHTGCVPSIIHRDLKTSNILLDKNMRAKVSDFGLSRISADSVTHVSSVVRGTVGYLDPEYYISQQLTTKSDVYSFGVILLELISGQEAISSQSFGIDCRNIVQWAKAHVECGDIQRIIDPTMHGYDMQSIWKIAEKALMCAEPHADMRPSMHEVIKDIEDAISIERDAEALRAGANLDNLRFTPSVHSSPNMGSPDFGPGEHYVSVDDAVVEPMAR